MDDLVQWLRGQLDEDERTARRAADYDDGAAHDVHGPPGTWACMDEAEWFGPSYRGGVIAPRIGNVNAPELGAHIVRHDPARVLREIDAKRQLLRTYEEAVTAFNDSGPAFSSYDRLTGSVSSLRRAVELLALPYAGRPGYRDEWRP